MKGLRLSTPPRAGPSIGRALQRGSPVEVAETGLRERERETKRNGSGPETQGENKSASGWWGDRSKRQLILQNVSTT